MAGWRQAPVNRLNPVPGSITGAQCFTWQWVSIKHLHGPDVGGHWSLVSSGAGNVITESQSWSLSEARLTVVKPIIFRPWPATSREISWGSSSPGCQDTDKRREREAGWNKSEMAEAAQIYSYERREGWEWQWVAYDWSERTIITSYWLPSITSLHTARPWMSWEGRNGSLHYRSLVPATEHRPKYSALIGRGRHQLSSDWATPSDSGLRAELPRSRQISESGLRKGNFSKLYVLVEILMVARQIKKFFCFPEQRLGNDGP